MVIQTILAKLKYSGKRLTPVVEALLIVLTKKPIPISVPEIMTELAKQKLKPNKTTVYRSIYALRELGLVSEIVLRDGSLRYELKTDEHKHHLICTKCGTVASIELAGDLDKIERKIEQQEAFEIMQHDLTFYGRCAKCKTA
jgi:Fur family ferric uptake transcriptional regulator